MATMVFPRRAAGAVHKLLLTERHQRPCADGPSTLKSSGGRESPARSTSCLIFDWGDLALGNPVDGCWKVCAAVFVRADFLQATCFHRVEHAKVVAEEFLIGEVRKCVDAKLVAVTLSVFCFHLSQVDFENRKTNGTFSLVNIRFPETLHKIFEGTVRVGFCLDAAAHYRVGRIEFDAAEALIGHLAFDAHESLVAPLRAPRVLDLPIVDAVVGAIADKENSMVKAIAALRCQDSALIISEGVLVSLDRD